MTTHQIITSSKRRIQPGHCFACGTDKIKPGRRYCTPECRQQIQWVLSLSRGLLRIFNTRFAAFSFNDYLIALDILPTWSNEISRFTHDRSREKKPAEDLKELILSCGQEWYQIIENRNSKSYASFFLLRKNHNTSIKPESIKPDLRIKPRFSSCEKKSIRLLELKLEELLKEGQTNRIKSAYKKMAKVHHPDVGGDTEKFKQLNEAHQQLLQWAENPQFTSRKALSGCWSYDGATNRWAPPL
jgi:hypothetical protein